MPIIIGSITLSRPIIYTTSGQMRIANKKAVRKSPQILQRAGNIQRPTEIEITSRESDSNISTINNGLLLWVHMEEGSGTVAGDSSGQGNNLTIVGAAWTGGKYGYGLDFEAAESDYTTLST